MFDYQNGMLQYLASQSDADAAMDGKMQKQILKIIDTQNEVLELLDPAANTPPPTDTSSWLVYLMGGILIGFIAGIFFANHLLSNKMKAKENKGRQNKNDNEFTEIRSTASSTTSKRKSNKDSDGDETSKFI